MDSSRLNWITSYIWGIADDVLRDLYVRGKYRDVILPMTVLRRLDAVLEDSKQAVLDMKASLDEAGVVEQAQALRQAAGQAFFNTSKFTMRDLHTVDLHRAIVDLIVSFQAGGLGLHRTPAHHQGTHCGTYPLLVFHVTTFLLDRYALGSCAAVAQSPAGGDT